MPHDNPRKTSLPLGELLRITWRVNKLVWKEKKWTIISLVLLLVLLSASPIARSGLQGLFINQLVKLAGTGVANALLIFFLAGVIIVDVISSLLMPLQGYLRQAFSLYLRQHFQLLVLKKKGELDLASHEDAENLTLIEKINQHGIWRIEAIPTSQLIMLGNVVTLVFTCAVLGAAEWWVLLIIIAATIPEIVVESKIAVTFWQGENVQSEKRRHMWNLRQHFDFAGKVMELKIFGNIRYFFEKIKSLWQEILAEEMYREKSRSLAQLLSLLLSNISMGIAMVWFVWQVIEGKLQLGTMTFLLASITSFRMALSSIFSEAGRFYEHTLFVSDVLKLLDLKPIIESPVPGIIIPKESTPEIVFDNVTFTYPSAAKPSLVDFSLRIAPGEKIAFVGVNGAGKTTFIKLLCRFYDPQQGNIFIYGKNIKEINLESWYQHLGVIFQDFSNYYLMAKEAIALGNTNVPMEDAAVQQAAMNAEADSFINDWPKKYDQPLGKLFRDGVQPSGGQWQKLALSRVFYREANVLILDEPTSAIDAEAEAKIFAQMAALPKDKTVILISHRFSTVRQADRIAVIDAGKMIELGSHTELLSNNKTYARLFNLQAKGYQ